MLITTLTLKAKVTKGSNVIEQQPAGYEVITTHLGNERRPKFEYANVTGASVGAMSTIEAPIDLLPGDELRVDADLGTVHEVIRGGSVFWPKAEGGKHG